MSSEYVELHGPIGASRVVPKADPPRIVIDPGQRKVPTSGVLERLAHEGREAGDARDRHYLVEVRGGQLDLGPVAEPKAAAVYARPDGQVIYRLVDVDAEGVPCEDELYASVLADGDARAPEPLGAESVRELRDAYRLVVRERHRVAGGGR